MAAIAFMLFALLLLLLLPPPLSATLASATPETSYHESVVEAELVKALTESGRIGSAIQAPVRHGDGETLVSQPQHQVSMILGTFQRNVSIGVSVFSTIINAAPDKKVFFTVLTAAKLYHRAARGHISIGGHRKAVAHNAHFRKLLSSHKLPRLPQPFNGTVTATADVSTKHGHMKLTLILSGVGLSCVGLSIFGARFLFQRYGQLFNRAAPSVNPV